MRRRLISSASLLSVVLSTILSLFAIYSGVGIAKADSVIATIPVGAEPFVVAVNANTGNVYVGSHPSNTVTVISSGNHVIAILHVGVTPRKIAVNPSTGNVYVANAGSNTVSVISPSNQVIATIPVGTVPGGIALNPNTGNVYVTNAGNGNANEVNFNTVSVISGSTNQVIATIPVGMAPFKVAVNPNTGNVYVINVVSNTVSVISGSTNQVIATIPVGIRPQDVAVNANTGNVYVANIESNTVSVISGSTNQVIATIPVGTFPQYVAFNPNTGNVYVLNPGSGTVSVISASNQVIATIPVGIDPEGVAVNPNTGNVYVTNFDSNTVSAISPSNQVIATIPVGGAPRGIAVNPNTGNVYVGNEREPSTVSVISTAASSQLPHTTITSARDGNGATIQNGGTTLSTSIQLTFTATPGTNPIAGFECRLDNSTFSPCTSPTTLTNLPDGKHNFQVRAVDTAGNKDPNPAIFSWTVGAVTPTQSIQQLIQLKHSMHLSPATDQTLDIRLNIALQFAQNNVKSGTCIQLTVFIKQVQAELRVGQVSSVQATQLIQGAQNIQTALGCTVASSANGIGPLSASASPSSLNLTQSQQKQPQTTASSRSLLQPQSQSPYPYSNQYRYPSQYLQSQLTQRQQLPPISKAGVSQTVNENTKVSLDGRASYSPTGGVVVAYQWTQLATTGVPVVLTGANTATPTLITPTVPSDTELAFSLRVLDNHGDVSTNPTIVYVMVKHDISNIPASSNSINQLQKQQQQLPLPTPHSPNIPNQPAPPNTFDFPQRHLR